MPARRGDEFIQALKEHPVSLWHRGNRVEDITQEPGFSNHVRVMADRYDMQYREQDLMLFKSPSSGDLVARSFMIPETSEELVSVGDAMKRSMDETVGMAGRDPAYLNRALSSYAAAAPYLNGLREGFGDNACRYHEYVRENDLATTHTLINPQINRSVGASKQADPFLAARVKEETDKGVIIKGARMLATLPMADELLVFPSTLLKNTDDDAPYAFAFGIPSATKGLKFICRESVDYGRNHFDHPLGSRFEEQDAMVIFEDVFVPWERIFLYRNPEACNQAYQATSAVVHMSHQVVCKAISKTEYILGLISLMVEAIGIERFQHIQEKVTEVWVALETMKAFRRAAEADAAPNDYGMMTPNWDPLDASRNLYPRLYPRLIEIIQQIGASGLVGMPTLADLEGPLADDIARYYQSARLEAKERIPLFRLAWDTAVSAFGSRQVLYERFFFGDPVRMASAVFSNHDRTEYMERVRDFLRSSDEEA